ncbi:zinc finger CCHC domain-containing protein 9 [Cyclospora cayetanensis]|uniref:Zinc finger CCHC domain-containing protein 9 n=1 Tax=Cyclospora cayetanensis TaxID=88456 RepID=A0A6P5WDE5_9EIME|nr:zinc finger CCHC domain-containing protein 9 [Cyclospora cayetanensis]
MQAKARRAAKAAPVVDGKQVHVIEEPQSSCEKARRRERRTAEVAEPEKTPHKGKRLIPASENAKPDEARTEKETAEEVLSKRSRRGKIEEVLHEETGTSPVTGEGPGSSLSSLPPTRGKLRRKREGFWGPEEIAERKRALLEELDRDRVSLSSSRLKRIKARLSELSKAEKGETQVGGQLVKVSKNKQRKKKQKGSKEELEGKERAVRRHKRPRIDAHEEDPRSNKRSKKICLRCRKRGHLLHECRQGVSQAQAEGAATSGICFNCGSHNHTLKNCKKPRAEDGALPFALCFICNAKGHISSQCPQSKTGKYPKGGCCRTCGSIYHLQAECAAFLSQKAELQQRREEKKARQGQEKKPKEQKSKGGDEEADAYWLQQLKP